MQPNLNEAIHLLGIYTAERFDLWALAGQSKASCRAHVMSMLLGKSVPQSKAGVNALRDAFYAAASITGEWPAQREERFADYCKAVQS